LAAPISLDQFDGAFANAFRVLEMKTAAESGVSPDQGTASLEQGFRFIEKILRFDHFSTPQTIITTLVRAESHGMQRIGSMILQQISRMASTLYGRNHPHAIWTQHLLQLINSDAPLVLQRLMDVFCDGVENELGPDDVYVFLARSFQYETFFELHKRRSDTLAGTLFKNYESLLETWMAKTTASYYDNLCLNYAVTLLEKENYEMAESLLSKAPDHLDQWITEGAETETRIRIILHSVINLGRAFAGQGKIAKARSLWTRAITACTGILGPDDPRTVEAVLYLGDLLASQHLDDEARVVYGSINELLSPYMLRPKGVED